MQGKLPTEWADVGVVVPGHSSGSVKVHCPKCHSQRNNKSDKSLSVNLSERIWMCHYPQCGWTGRLYDKDMIQDRQRKQYKIPAVPPDNLSSKSCNWLHGRGLSDYTIKRFKITDGNEWMPQENGEVNCIRFPYYRNDKIVNIKYRDAKKNFKLTKDSELILFNLDAITGVDECVITEGEIDCMSVYEAGYMEVASVPNGASKGNAKLEYLDNCFDVFEGKKRIVIATDGDTAGITLRDELSRRLGRHRCYYVVYPEGCKDFNNVLIRHGKDDDQIQAGKDEIKSLIKNATAFPVEGVYRVQDFETELDQYFHEGVKPGDKIGYSDFDKIFTFKKGEFTTITGIPNCGKSAFLDQCLVRLSSRFGWKHAVCSFENQPIKGHVAKLAACFLGKKFDDKVINETQWNWAKFFTNEHFYFFSTEDISLTIDALLDKAKELVTRYGIDSFTIDPWNYVEFNIEGKSETETMFISRALTKITKFCRAYDVHVFLIAHPVKMQKKADGFEIPNLYSISGSSHFNNKTDNGITVHIDEPTGSVGVYVQKVRFQPTTGKKGFAVFRFEVGTGRYAEVECSYSDELPIYLQRTGYDYDLWGMDPIQFKTNEVTF